MYKNGGYEGGVYAHHLSLGSVHVEFNLSGTFVKPVRFLDCMLKWFVEGRARLFAKLRSSNWVDRVHWMPLGLSAVMFVIQSIASNKRIGEMTHPCLTLDCLGHHLVKVLPMKTLHFS